MVGLALLCFESLPLYLGSGRYREASDQRDLAYRIMIIMRPVILMMASLSANGVIRNIGILAYSYKYGLDLREAFLPGVLYVWQHRSGSRTAVRRFAVLLYALGNAMGCAVYLIVGNGIVGADVTAIMQGTIDILALLAAVFVGDRARDIVVYTFSSGIVVMYLVIQPDFGTMCAAFLQVCGMTGCLMLSALSTKDKQFGFNKSGERTDFTPGMPHTIQNLPGARRGSIPGSSRPSVTDENATNLQSVKVAQSIEEALEIHINHINHT